MHLSPPPVVFVLEQVQRCVCYLDGMLEIEDTCVAELMQRRHCNDKDR